MRERAGSGGCRQAARRPHFLGGIIKPAASVVVPAYRAARTIAACLESLRIQDLAEPFEVIVVASGDDSTADIVMRSFPEVVLLRAAGRLTPGAARNAGVREAGGEIVAFCAADCLAGASWLRGRVERHREGHNLVAGGIDTCSSTSLAGLSQYMLKFGGTLAYSHRTFTGTSPLFHLSYSRATLQRFGEFPEEMAAGEDTLYNHRLIEAGERILFDGAIRVGHANARSWAEVRAGIEWQAGWSGQLARAEPVGRYLRNWAGASALTPIRAWWRLALTVARFRPDLMPRFLLATPMCVAAFKLYARSFRRTFREGYELELMRPAQPVSRVLPPSPAGPPVSVVIAAFDEERWLAACLDSLLAQTYTPLEVIVVDDGSSDATAEIARSRGVRVLSGSHRGPALARNLGASAAAGEILVFIDADMVLDARAIERLVEPIAKGHCTGTFTKDLWVANPAQPWAQCWTLNRGLQPGHVFPVRFPDRWANFRAISRDAFLRVGGFDDVGYGEDMTLAPKLGEEAIAVPGSVMWHYNPSTLREIWGNACWIGRGVRLREIPGVYRRFAPWRSLRTGIAVARRTGLKRFLLFKLVYDLGILRGFTLSHLWPGRHWK